MLSGRVTTDVAYDTLLIKDVFRKLALSNLGFRANTRSPLGVSSQTNHEVPLTFTCRKSTVSIIGSISEVGTKKLDDMSASLYVSCVGWCWKSQYSDLAEWYVDVITFYSEASKYTKSAKAAKPTKADKPSKATKAAKTFDYHHHIYKCNISL